MRLIVGIGGASGPVYGIRLLEVLKKLGTVETHLVLSRTARRTIPIETDWTVSDVEGLAHHVYKPGDLAASIASGSFHTDGMIVAACSMKLLSAITHSYADDLISRAADVTLKEQRRLVLMPRETPLHKGHCKLMMDAMDLGAVIAPPMPSFYGRPKSLEEMIDHSIGRVLDLFQIDVGLAPRWTGPSLGSHDAG